MENRKDIGEFIKDKIFDLDKNPNDKVWNSINETLNKRRKRRILFYLTSTLFGLLLLISTTILFTENFTSKNNKENKIKNNNDFRSSISNTDYQKDSITIKKKDYKSKTKTTKKLIQSNDKLDVYEVVSTYKIYINKNNSKTFVTKKNSKLTNKSYPKSNVKIDKKAISKNKKNIKTIPKKYKNTVPDIIKNKSTQSKNLNFNNNKNQLQIFENENNDSVNKKIKDKNLILDTIKKSDSLNFKIIKKDSISKKKKNVKEFKKSNENNKENKTIVYFSVFYGPTYYNSLSKSTSLLKAENQFDKKGILNSSFGMYGRTMFNEKIGVRLGINETNLDYSTTINNTGPNVWVLGNSNIELSSNLTKENFNDSFKNSNKIELVQKIRYLEFPIEAYFVLQNNNKIGIDATLGFSTYFLQKNQVFAKSENVDSILIGKANNIKEVVGSLNLGIILNYKINNRFQIDVAPIMKYQIAPFTNSTNFKPIIFSIQTGITVNCGL